MNIEEILHNELTEDQYNTVIDNHPEVLCLACAGSGKSRTLAFRISRLIYEGVAPESIIAFTFTEKAAESIKRRVADALENVVFCSNGRSDVYWNNSLVLSTFIRGNER